MSNRSVDTSFGLKAIGLLLTFSVLLSACNARVTSRDSRGEADKEPAGSSAPVQGARPEWFNCEVDADCTVERGLCDEPMALNRAFLDVFKAYRDEWNPSLDCVTRVQWTQKHTAHCVKKRCALPPNENF